MKKYTILSAAALFSLVSTAALPAVEVIECACILANQKLFGIQAGANQQFTGREDLITSVSLQEYTTGEMIVTEVDVDLSGANQVLRIYSMRQRTREDLTEKLEKVDLPVNPAGLVKNAANAGGLKVKKIEEQLTEIAQDTVSDLVVKTYPNTTHAKTIEMMIGSRGEVIEFYKTFKKFWGSKPASQIGGKIFVLDPAREKNKK